MAGLGVASFGHINGVHVQNKDTWETYSEAIDRGELPLSAPTARPPTSGCMRELVLQMKLGRLRPAYFAEKYGVDILDTFAAPFASLRAEGYLTEADARRRGAHPRGPDARGLAAAPLLPAAAHEHSVHDGAEVRCPTPDVRKCVCNAESLFSETDVAGIVHFSNYFRYFEDAEHALWREAGLSVHPDNPPVGWPRVAASCNFHRALKFEQEFEVVVRISELARRSNQLRRGDFLSWRKSRHGKLEDRVDRQAS